MHAAWHFWYAASLGGESGLREVGLGGIHPLTRRYAPKIGFTSMLLWRIRIISIF
ncbi:TPA: DUF3265 domain-containing protein [Vibrio vulnificus]|nr:DUF3265 domain-containing protein [Vibrio vulnificus]HAS8196821.1 DUF3265 domain-containing protein [Vibrio vulnificus]HAS8367259.1 DUF3265 domain-containing protein [Vibrio vulnificus]